MHLRHRHTTIRMHSRKKKHTGNTDVKQRIWGILSEESLLGRITSRLWILFGANVLFVLFSLPVVTAGPAWVALYTVCLKTLRVDDSLNPIKEFWKGFCLNFKQALIGFLGFLLIAAVLVLDIMFVARTQSVMRLFRYPVYVLTGIVLLILFHVIPVMAAFADSLRTLIRNGIYFAAKNPVRAVLILALNVGPMIWTYMDVVRLPLYAFLWTSFGFSSIAMICSRLLLKDFEQYLPDIDIREEADQPETGESETGE